MAPGRPPLAHQGAGPVAQPYGGNGSFEIDPVQLGLARGGGKPLPQALLAKMEAAFGADFSAVRVHIGPQAARIGAIAFTTGNDLYFAPGRFQPESVEGQQLIGHELAHVIQQRHGRVRAPGSGVAVVHDRGLESDADRWALRAAAYKLPTRLGDVDAASKHASPGSAMSAGSDCSCHGSCGASSPQVQARNAVPVQLSTKDVGRTQIPGKGLRNPPRKVVRNKGLTNRQQAIYFRVEGPLRRKRRRHCGFGGPAMPLRGLVWNGDSRRAWTPAALLTLPAACAACGGVATAIDHVVPYRVHIGNTAPLSEICDGECHYLGVSAADANAAYSDVNNLQALCAVCNGAKAALDRANAGNVPAPPTPAGACPNAPNGCGVGLCLADICL